MADAKLNIIISAKDQTGGVFKKLGGSVQKLGKVAMVGFGAAAAGIAAVGAGAVKLAADAASLETVQAAFEGITEASGESASKMLEALRTQSAGMITNADLMTSYNKAAQLVGTTFANELPDAMGMVGKVAAATGQDMGFLMDSLVTGIGRLSPMILDNLGIQVDLTQAYEDYAAANGLVASEMSKTEQQAALMAQVMGKLQTNTANMPDVAGSAAASFESFKVTLQNTKDQIGLALIPVLQPLMESLGKLASTILPPLIELFTTYMVPAMQKVSEVLTVVVGFIAKFTDALKAGADPITAFNYAAHQMFPPEVAKRIIEIRDKITEFIDKVKVALKPVIDFIKENVEMQDVLIALGAVVAAVVIPAIVSIIASIGPLIAIFAVVVAAVALVRTAWEENWGGIQEKTAAVIEFIKELISAFKKAFEGDFTELKEIASKIWDALWTWVGERLQDAIDWIRAINWAEIGRNIIEGIKSGVVGAAQLLIDAVVNAAKNALAAVKGALGIDSPSKVFAVEIGVPISTGIAEGIKKSASVISDGLIEVIKKAKDDASEALFGFGGGIGGIGGSFASRLQSDLEPLREELEKLTEYADSQGGVLPWNMFNRRLEIIQQIRKEEERIAKLQEQQGNLAFLQEQMKLVSLIKEYGLNPADILGGMKLGLDASLPDLLDAMTAAMQKIVEAANAELGIASPSKIFEKLGKYVMQGFARGIDASAALPQQSFNRTVPALAPSFNTNNTMGNVYINNPAQMGVYLRQQELVRQRRISRRI